MYKKQMTFQNIICYIALIAGVIVFIYSLGIMTDLYDTLYTTMTNPNDYTETWVPGSIVYYNMQGFNKSLLICSIIYLLLGVYLFISQTNKRRRYYVGNYIAIALFVIFTLYLVIWSHIQIEIFKGQWLNVDFEALKEYADLFNSKYTESTFWFDIHYGVALICLASAGLLVYNTIWKIQLMKEEERLIKEGERA